jgi:hypothetical protein
MFSQIGGTFFGSLAGDELHFFVHPAGRSTCLRRSP